MPWRRSFNQISIPHDDTAWALELLLLQPEETLDSMWVGVSHRMGLWGPTFSDPADISVLMHGMILVEPAPTPVPAPLNDPFADWLLREMAQWSSDTQLWSTADGVIGFHWSHHPTKKLEGRRRNETGDNLSLWLSMQTTTQSSLEFRENMRTTVHVEAFILD